MIQKLNVLTDPNTLYYFYSTIAQVLAAISALLAVFTHFKIIEIRDFLVGDGMSIYNRKESKERGYEILKPKHLKRLRDSIDRKYLKGIFEIINLLSKHEDISVKRGFKYLESSMKKRMNKLNRLKSLTIKSIVFAFIAIISSLISIVFVNALVCIQWLYWIDLIIVFTLTSISITYTYLGIKLGLGENENL